MVSKHRNGALKNVKIRFAKELARFTNYDHLAGDFGEVHFNTVNDVITLASRMNSNGNSIPPISMADDEDNIPF